MTTAARVKIEYITGADDATIRARYLCNTHAELVDLEKVEAAYPLYDFEKIPCEVCRCAR